MHFRYQLYREYIPRLPDGPHKGESGGANIFSRLLIGIAERSIDRANQLLDLPLLPVDVEHLQINLVLQRLLPATAKHACSSSDDLLSLGEILYLPDVPGAINHGVVKPERRVTRRDVEIRAGIARDGEVAARVDAVRGLHRRLEGVDILRRGDERGDLGGRAVALSQVVGEVALDAAGVVTETVAAGVLRGCGVGHGSQRANVSQESCFLLLLKFAVLTQDSPSCS